MPALLLLLWGNISSHFNSPHCPGGLGAHHHLPHLGIGTCGHLELFIKWLHLTRQTNPIFNTHQQHCSVSRLPTSTHTSYNDGSFNSPPAAEAQTLSQLLPMSSTNSTSQVSTPPQNAEDEEADQLASAHLFTTAPGNKHEPLLSMHVSASIKKRIWAGQYVDLAYLLETQLVPDDDKAYEFSCSNSNTNKLSLTTAKPKVKVDSYNPWNKAFRVLMEIVVKMARPVSSHGPVCSRNF